MIRLFGDAAVFVRRQYTVAAHLSHRSFVSLRWRKNEFVVDGDVSTLYEHGLASGPILKTGQKVRIGFGYGAMGWGGAKVVWPVDGSNLFYRAYCTPYRKGRSTIVHGRPSNAFVEMSDEVPLDPVCVSGLRLTFVERAEQRPRVEGVYVRSDRSWLGSFPGASHLCVVVTDGLSGSDSNVAVSPYRSLAEDVQFGPAEVREGAFKSLGVWSTEGEVFRWVFNLEEIYGVVVRLKQHRTLFGRETRRTAAGITIEYWRH